MLKERERLEKEICVIQKQLKKLPDGKLILCFDGRSGYKWFRGDGHNKEYIKKEDRKLAEQLAMKNVLTLRLKELLKKKSAADFYLRHYPKEISKSNQLISESSEYQKLLSSYFTPLNQELNMWMHSEYEKNGAHPEQLIHKTMTGEYVRSKSEELIYTYLQINKIPFRYECLLKLGGVTLYPDFTIRHPRTGEFYYYEHFGLMDNRDYARNAYSKMELYHANGIIPSVNLITTFETKDHPLSIETIRKEIDYYFL